MHRTSIINDHTLIVTNCIAYSKMSELSSVSKILFSPFELASAVVWASLVRNKSSSSSNETLVALLGPPL